VNVFDKSSGRCLSLPAGATNQSGARRNASARSVLEVKEHSQHGKSRQMLSNAIFGHPPGNLRWGGHTPGGRRAEIFGPTDRHPYPGELISVTPKKHGGAARILSTMSWGRAMYCGCRRICREFYSEASGFLYLPDTVKANGHDRRPRGRESAEAPCPRLGTSPRTRFCFILRRSINPLQDPTPAVFRHTWFAGWLFWLVMSGRCLGLVARDEAVGGLVICRARGTGSWGGTKKPGSCRRCALHTSNPGRQNWLCPRLVDWTRFSILGGRVQNGEQNCALGWDCQLSPRGESFESRKNWRVVREAPPQRAARID